ncbi:helix-turn-helix domain-containing protein [Litchfieldia salsa]|uniref:AraC-type DNA-binding protein n=1 Tax=Litchfieldia salsa TaxID=930152 RepID=A0A1H0T2D7_9BACI|nr:helix-turn-helix domain-containing protein [Litchfieldia salsa]SDP48114.1 AraC-type DNA-binding protein [Litchfieldia salsa]
MDMVMLRDKEDIAYFSKLIYETIHIPVFYINSHLEVIIGHPATYTANPIYPQTHELFTQLDFFNDPINIPVFRTTNFLENFISIKVESNGNFQGAWVLGPSVYIDVADETIQGLINDFQVKVSQEDIKRYYQSLPTVNKLTLLHAGLLANYLLFSKRISVTDVIQKENTLKIDFTMEDSPELLISKSRQEISFHTSYKLEKDFFKYVKEGRKEELLRKMGVPDTQGKLGVLSKKSHLRSEKNLVISAITLATRYAIDGGLHPEMAFTMSDLYIQGLEEINDALEVQTYLRKALCDFAERVLQERNHQYTNTIIDCQSYIFKNLYEEITLGQLAYLVNMHPNYLSTLFKKEVGISITEYILKQKVEEAKKLLTYSNYPLSEIYSWLNFHDQSHFTKVFKRYTGTTPKKYKKHQLGN